MEPSRAKEMGIVIGVSTFTVLVFLFIGLVARTLDVFFGPVGLIIAALGLMWVALAACSYAALHSWPAGRHTISIIAVLAAAGAGFSWTSLVGGLLMSAFIFSAAGLIASASRERIVFRIRPTVMPGIRLLLAGILLVVVTFLLPEVRQLITDGKILVPADTIAVVLRPAAPFIASLLPGYTADSTVDDLINQQIAQQQAALPEGFVIPPQEKQRALQEISRSVGMPLEGSETLPDILTNYSNQYIQSLTSRDGILVTIILIAIGLLAVRALVPLFAWVVLGISFGLFFIARRARLITIVETQVSAQQLKI